MKMCLLSGSSPDLLYGGQGEGREKREGKLKSFTWMAVFILEVIFHPCVLHSYKAHRKCMFSLYLLFQRFFLSVIILLEISY